MMSIPSALRMTAAAALLAATLHAQAQPKPFLDVGKQEPITILTPSTPWLPAFTSLVEQYEAQTGNKIKLDVNPFGGVLDKARNDARSGGGTYDVVMLDTQWTIEMYEGGFLTPLTDIDAAFTMPKEVLSFGDSGYWNAAKRWRTSNGGKLMAFTVLGNVQMWYYRTDALQEAGVTPPRTVAEVLASCAKLNKPGATYGAVMRGERGNPIRYDWMHWMLGSGGSVVKDPENGDYTVTLNSPINKTTLDQFIEVATKCGAPNPGAVSQGEAIQLLATGKAVQAQLVLAAWAGLQDPKKSAVAGKLDVLPIPRMANGQHGAVIGNWHYAVPKGAKNKMAALAFGRWFLSQPAQYAYGKAGGIPVRSDVLSSDLAKDPMNRWMTPYLEVLKTAKQELGYQEAAQVEAVLGLKLNQALIGELSSGKALNQAAQEIKVIFEKSGRKTGVGVALAE